MSISGPPQFGSPDGQRGITTAQKLLATTAPGTSSATVTVPPNAETIVVAVPLPPAGPKAVCQGVTTGFDYPGLSAPSQYSTPSHAEFLFDVSSALDAQVTITLQFSPARAWYVISDQGVRITADASKLTSRLGQQHIVPGAPSTLVGDHPPVELQSQSFYGITATTTILAAPGAAKRYRIFGAWAVNVGTGDTCLIEGTYNGNPCYLAAPGSGSPNFPLTGLALDANALVEVQVLFGSAGNYMGSVLYTTETV